MTCKKVLDLGFTNLAGDCLSDKPLLRPISRTYQNLLGKQSILGYLGAFKKMKLAFFQFVCMTSQNVFEFAFPGSLSNLA